MSRNSQAAAVFEATLDELDVTLTTEAARRSALLAAADQVWSREIGRLLTRAEAQELMGVGTRQGISDHVARRRLFALPGGDGQLLFPAFQFGEDGRPLAGLSDVLRTLHGAFESPYSLAAWFTTPQEELGKGTPAESLRAGDREPVMLAAKRTHARLVH
jgi:hypothetical protein